MRALAGLLALVIALVAIPSLAAADGVALTRSYPEPRADGCTWWVALWADGAFTAAPDTCSPLSTPVNPVNGSPRVRGFPQVQAGNCTWIVAQWFDGSFASVPVRCPAGVTATRDGGAIGTPTATPPPAAAAPRFRGVVVGPRQDCDQSQITGQVVDRAGAGLDGYVIRTTWEGNEWRILTPQPPRDPGWFAQQVFSADQQRTYQVVLMDAAGQQVLSDPVNVTTLTLNCQDPGAVTGAVLQFTRLD
jgi:hypothetical protein